MKLFQPRPLLTAAFMLLAACAAPRPAAPPYNVKALRPHNPNAVSVKVSLRHQAVYVMEGDRLLMAAATCVGLPNSPTPKGSFSITQKIERKRSNSYGFFINGGDIQPGETRAPKPGRFVGYPMAYWCEFKPAYGFHTGYVHPVPRTHGCLRLHHSVAPKFYALVREGTPVSIAEEQPEDAKFANQIARPKDYLDPDPPAEQLISDKSAFPAPPEPLLSAE